MDDWPRPFSTPLPPPEALAAMFLKQWIGSPGHEANLSAPDYRETGVGTAFFQLEGMTWMAAVQVFGGGAEQGGGF